MKIIISFLALFIPLSVSAVTDYQCTFTKVATLETELKDANEQFLFVLDGDSAYMVGNMGTEKVAVTYSPHGISFIETTGTAALRITTVDDEGVAVHSRHTFFLGLYASQYYGRCEKRIDY